MTAHGQNDLLDIQLNELAEEGSEANTNTTKSEGMQKMLWRKRLWAKTGKTIFLQ